MDEHFVYVLYSARQGRTYVGSATDVTRRLAQHNAGRVKATHAGAPWIVVFQELCPDSLSARRREVYYKSAAGRRRLRLLLGDLTLA